MTPAEILAYALVGISDADDFAAIAADLAADFDHIDIRRLTALYLTPERH